MRISKVYTKTGDSGETGLGGGQRVPKDATRIGIGSGAPPSRSSFRSLSAGGSDEWGMRRDCSTARSGVRAPATRGSVRLHRPGQTGSSPAALTSFENPTIRNTDGPFV